MHIKVEAKKIDNMNSIMSGSYIKSDLMLDLEIQYQKKTDTKLGSIINKNLGIVEEQFILSYNQLSLCFGEDGLLKSIDAYSNFDRWINSSISLPKYKEYSYLSIKVLKKNDDRINIDIDPVFAFDIDKKILKIQTSKETDSNYYKICDKITVGLNQEKITSIYIEELVIDHNS